MNNTIESLHKSWYIGDKFLATKWACLPLIFGQPGHYALCVKLVPALAHGHAPVGEVFETDTTLYPGQVLARFERVQNQRGQRRCGGVRHGEQRAGVLSDVDTDGGYAARDYHNPEYHHENQQHCAELYHGSGGDTARGRAWCGNARRAVKHARPNPIDLVGNALHRRVVFLYCTDCSRFFVSTLVTYSSYICYLDSSHSINYICTINCFDFSLLSRYFLSCFLRSKVRTTRK